MQRFQILGGLISLCAVCCLAGCQHQAEVTPTVSVPTPVAQTADVVPVSPLASVTSAIAVIQALSGSNVMGIVRFTQTPEGVAVVADVSGLTPGKHGFHIHEYGDCSDPKGMSAGGHYNPGHEMHGLPGAEHHHPGDMGNLEAAADGTAHLEILLAGVTIAGDKTPILGRSVIIHVKADDGSQPTGNAGGRIGCGVIGVAKAK